MADNIGAIFSVDFESFSDIKKKLDVLTKQINSTANGKVKLDVNIEGIEKAVQDIDNLKKQNIQVLGNGQVKTVSVLNDELNRTIKLVENLTTGKKSISIDNNIEKNLKEQEKFINQMANGRENSQVRVSKEDYATELAQAKAINKAKEEAYKTGLKEKENLISQSKYLDNITTRLKSYQQTLNNRGNNSNAQKQLNSEIQEQINKYEQLRSENKLLSSEEKARINESLNQTKLQTSQLTAQQNGLSGILKNTASYAVGGSAIYAMINQLQSGIKAIHDVDDALRDLKRVSDDVANSTLQNFVNKANGMAVSLGHTTEGVIQATAMFKQLGYSFKDASDYMASNAMILSNVGDISVQDSSNAIVSTLKGFRMEAQDTTKVVDVLNETGNHFAITTGQLADGLRIGSASLAIANNSLEESTALITTGTEVLRDSDMVANGLKFGTVMV